MNIRQLVESLGNIDSDLIEEAEAVNSLQKRKRSWRITFLAASFVIALLITSSLQVPIVRAQSITVISNVATWISKVTNIPIYLPDNWKLVQDTDSNNQNYYYQVLGNEDSYNINIYRTKVSVRFNDQKDLLKKNGPVSESDFIGTISGEKITPLTPALSSTKPIENAETLDLIDGIEAYSLNNGTSIWWNYKGWIFEFTGSSGSLTILKELAENWSNSNIEISETGLVKIIGGNKLSIFYLWDKDGYRYEYVTSSLNFGHTIDVLNSFSQRESTN